MFVGEIRASMHEICSLLSSMKNAIVA